MQVKAAAGARASLDAGNTSEPTMAHFKHILVPTDGSALAGKAVDAAIAFAADCGARLTAFTAVPEYREPNESAVMSHHVAPPAAHHEAVRRLARETLDAVARKARAAGVDYADDFAECNRPHEAIIEAARRHACDLIFMASHGRRGMSALIHGSETQAVLTRSTIPTLVYR